MTEKRLFTIKTRMEEKDVHKFIYIATFLRSKVVIPILLVMSGLGAFNLSFKNGQLNKIKFLISWLVFIALVVAVIIMKVKRVNKKRMSTNEVDVFKSIETLDFYENFVKISSTSFVGEASVNYDNFFQALESKDYFITYFDKNQTSLIRKKDMDKETIEKLRGLYRNILGKKFKRTKI